MQLEFPVDLSFEGDCTRHSHPRVLSTGASPIPFLTGPIYLAFDESAFSASLSQGLLTDLLWFSFWLRLNKTLVRLRSGANFEFGFTNHHGRSFRLAGCTTSYSRI